MLSFFNSQKWNWNKKKELDISDKSVFNSHIFFTDISVYVINERIKCEKNMTKKKRAKNISFARHFTRAQIKIPFDLAGFDCEHMVISVFDIISCYCFFMSPATVHHCVQRNRLHVHVCKLARFNANQFDIHAFPFWSIQFNANIKLNYRHKDEASRNIHIMKCLLQFNAHFESNGMSNALSTAPTVTWMVFSFCLIFVEHHFRPNSILCWFNVLILYANGWWIHLTMISVNPTLIKVSFQRHN